MQVKLENGNKITQYRVYFSTRSLHPQHGDQTKLLTETTCHIDVITNKEKNESVSKSMEVSRGTACQHYNDKFNGVMGRKIAFTRALIIFNKEDRKIFWDRYKETARFRV